MATNTSRYELPNRRLDPEFTEIQAKSCRIITTNKILFNSVFSHWEFTVVDADGNEYSWKDFRCAEAADLATVKLAIYNHLVSSVEKIPEDGAQGNYLKTTTVVTDRGSSDQDYVG